MGRSGYCDDYYETWSLIRWRGAVTSAIRGKRGQSFLRMMLDALDALPEHKLAAHSFVRGGEVCALGAVAKFHNLDVSDLEPDYADDDAEVDTERVGERFGIANAMAAEIMFVNDDWNHASPEDRWQRVRNWIVSQLR